MKSYTDLKQSQELATFLPMISADMYYPLPCTDNDIPVFGEGGFGSIPCWSLAVLLELLPETICFEDNENDYAIEILIENGLYYLSYGNPLKHDVINVEPQACFIDACVEMIIKLHELNLL